MSRRSVSFSKVASITGSTKNAVMWTKYHTLRTSDKYLQVWNLFFQQSTECNPSPMVCQYIGHHIFKGIIKASFTPLNMSNVMSSSDDFTYAETNAIRYAAGYVPRALKKRLSRSKHANKSDLMLCLDDLLDDGREEQNESTDWLQAINGGGLLCVNNMTFELFLTMERELRCHLSSNPETEFTGSEIKMNLKQSEDVLFLWSMIGAGWEEEYCTHLLGMVVDMWVCIRGFSQATAWIERYKEAQKKNLQKAKALRKNLNT